MTVWQHRRKGLVVGTEIPQDDETSEWMFVTLDEPVQGALDFWDTGETVTLRRRLMTLVPNQQNRSE